MTIEFKNGEYIRIVDKPLKIVPKNENTTFPTAMDIAEILIKLIIKYKDL